MEFKNDFMSKVMSRKVGGGSGSCESSPVKQQTKLTESSIQDQLITSNFQRTISSEAIVSQQKNSVDYDEIDGFIKDQLESKNDNGNEIYAKCSLQQIAKERNNSKIIGLENGFEIDLVDVNVENDDKIPTDAENGTKANELIIRGSNDLKEPNVEMFDENDSNSGSSPFIITSFYSLNTTEESTNCFVSDIGTADNKCGIVDMTSKESVLMDEKLFIEKESQNQESVKKSRKQNVPKRIKKTESAIEDGGVSGEDFVGFTKTGKDFDIKMADHVEILERDTELPDKVKWKESCTLSQNREAELTKACKSRKQCKPKRIDQLEKRNGSTCSSVFDEEKADTKTFAVRNNVKFDTNGKHVESEDDERLELQQDNGSVIDVVEENDHKGDTNPFRKHDQQIIGLVKDPENFASNISGSEITDSQDMVLKSGNIDHFASLSSNPFYYGFSRNLNLISTLSPGMLQGGSTAPSGFALDENGPENLEVIRQLREIRCNRYRKISISEKREISAYANTHGVSQAAAYYNVSKSAVSMWTKLDFSNADEETAMKRKNCMSGNDKFEALCRKVKKERENKFKGMCKEDKFEVSRYAKLVGVREMSRCLGVALGTVSGWMRQFPYKVDTDSPDEKNKHNEVNDSIDEATNVVQNKKSGKKRKKSEPFSNRSKIQKDSVASDIAKEENERNWGDDAKNKQKLANSNGCESMSGVDMNVCDNTGTIEEVSLVTKSEHKDDIDKMIEETLQKPDIDQCFEDIKELIKDSPLENDNFFRSLFDRVIACRADKYKSLKPSEKLEVVRYAKRIGVRRVAKIMGLATGTLSGWNTKYQSSLSITDPSLDMSNKTELLVSYLSPDKNVESESVPMTPAALMDNVSEKSEVTAVKLLFKDTFQTLLQKIEVAKQVKFRNITTEEKIEFVKCSKLVGIRPTARVFGIPIGTLSGWITKYSKLLHPAYHVDVDQETGTNLSDGSSQISYAGLHHSNTVGRNASLPGVIDSNLTWSQGLPLGGPRLELDLLSQFQDLPTSQSSLSLLESSSSPSIVTETGFQANSKSISNGDKDLNDIYKTDQTENTFHKKRDSLVSLDKDRAIKTDLKESVKHSVVDDDFEKEAKVLAEMYLTLT